MSDTPTASPVVLGRWEKPGNLASIAALAAAGQVTILPHELIRTTDGRVYHWTTSALEIVSAPVHHGTVANVAALEGLHLLPSCTRGVHPCDTAFVTSAGCEYRVTSGVNATATWAACAAIPTSASAIGADPAGTAATAVSTHNTATDSHTDIRTLVADRVPISATRIGSTGPTPLTTTALSAAAWAALPVGWRGIISADVALASGLPAADVYHLQKVSNRDVSGGAAYQAQGYLSPTLYVGVAATSSDLPTWSVALTSARGTTVSDVGASLLALATPSAVKVPRINPDATITLIDVPSGGTNPDTPHWLSLANSGWLTWQNNSGFWSGGGAAFSIAAEVLAVGSPNSNWPTIARVGGLDGSGNAMMLRIRRDYSPHRLEFYIAVGGTLYQFHSSASITLFDASWHKVVATSDGTPTGIKVYFDGTELAGSIANIEATTPGAPKLYVGGDSAGNAGWLGLVRQLCISVGTSWSSSDVIAWQDGSGLPAAPTWMLDLASGWAVDSVSGAAGEPTNFGSGFQIH